MIFFSSISESLLVLCLPHLFPPWLLRLTIIMFEPTIKYRRVNDSPKDITESLKELTLIDKQESSPKTENVIKTSEKDEAQDRNTSKDDKEEEKAVVASKPESTNPTAAVASTESYSFTFEEEEEKDSKIEVDPNDKERIIVTLSTGRQFSADRYCPHAGADLSYHGKVAEDDYPPEIGPVLMCPIHYWEFALEKGGRGGSGFTSINACPVDVAEKCTASAEKKKLDW